MSAQAFFRTVSWLWLSRLVRIPLGLLILAAAGFAHYFVAKIPRPINVETSTPPYSPINASLAKHDQLVLTYNNIAPAGSDTVLLASDGADFVSVEARFSSASISNDFITLLRTNPDEKFFPSTTPQLIEFTAISDEEARALSEESQGSAPCHTSIQVKLPTTSSALTELRFFQLTPGSDKHRTLEMKPIGGSLVVELQTSNDSDDLGRMQGLDCSKTLTIGEWHRSFSAPAPIIINVPDQSSFRFSFTDGGTQPSIRGGVFYEPFRVESHILTLSALSKIVDPAPSSSPPPAFVARTQTGRSPLIVKNIGLGADELRLNFAGEAMVQVDGEYVGTFSLTQFIKDNQVLFALMVMIDAALLEWTRRTFFTKRQRPSSFETID